MQLSGDHQELLKRAIRAAEEAGDRIMGYYGTNLKVDNKGLGSFSGDVVTKADVEAQQIIYDILFAKGDQDPLLKDIAVLGEEDDHNTSKRFERPYTFLIDPLDGTRGFLDRTNSFAVSIGLVQRDGTPVFGVVLLPALGRRYVGIHETKCTENGEILSQRDLANSELVLWLSEAEMFPAVKNSIWHGICRHIKDTTPIAKIRPQVLGSPVHKGCNTIAGAGPALYVGLPRSSKGVSLWDLAAIAAIVTGAGGWASDIHGQPLELNRRDNTYVHHKGFLFSTHEALARAVIEAYENMVPNSFS